MGLPEVKADIELVRQGLVANKDANLRTELTENLLPLLDGLVKAIQEEFDDVGEELADHGEAIDQLIDGAGDVLYPETAAKILGLFLLGKQMSKELNSLLPKMDDMSKKRVRHLLKMFDQGVLVMEAEIAEMTLDPEEVETAPKGPDAAPGETDAEGDEGDEDEDEDAKEGA